MIWSFLSIDRAPHIFTRIVKEGFLVVEQQRFRFSRELAELFYEEHRKKPFFGDLVDYITSGPVVGQYVYYLQKFYYRTISIWRKNWFNLNHPLNLCIQLCALRDKMASNIGEGYLVQPKWGMNIWILPQK